MITKIKKTTFIFFYTTLMFIFSANQAFAQTGCNLRNVSDFKGLIQNIISCFLTPIVYLTIATSILVFLWGVFKFAIIDAGVKDKAAAKSFMFWGIVGIFVMVSLWGLVGVLQATFNFSDDITPRPVNLRL